MKKKRLVISCYVTESLSTGVGRYLEGYIEHLLELNTTDITLLLSNELKQQFDSRILHKVEIIDLRIGIKNRLFKRLAYYWKQWFFQNSSSNLDNYDELWIPNTVPIFKGKLAVKVTIHDLAEFDTKTYSNWNGLIRKLFVYSIVKNANQISVVSEFSKQRLLANTSVNEGNVIVEKPKFTYLKRFKTTRKDLELNPRSFFLYVGRFSKNKNLQILVKVYELAKKLNYTLLPIVLVGPNSKDCKSLKQEIKTKQLESHFHFKHFITDEELPIYYKLTKAFIYPSKYEGFGLPPQEALFMGAKLILSNIPVLIENYREKAVFFNEDSEEDLLRILLRFYNVSS